MSVYDDYSWDSMEIREDFGPGVVLNCSTTGCGCCAESSTIKEAAEATRTVKRYIADRKREIKTWEEWLRLMSTSDTILKLPEVEHELASN